MLILSLQATAAWRLVLHRSTACGGMSACCYAGPAVSWNK